MGAYISCLSASDLLIDLKFRQKHHAHAVYPGCCAPGCSLVMLITQKAYREALAVLSTQSQLERAGCIGHSKQMISAAEQMSFVNHEGYTCLGVACMQPDALPVVKALLLMGASPNRGQGYQGCNALQLACFHGAASNAQAILQSRAMTPFKLCRLMKSVSKQGLSALHYAVLGGSVRAVENVLQHGADIFKSTQKPAYEKGTTYAAGCTALHMAAVSGRLDMAHIILQHYHADCLSRSNANKRIRKDPRLAQDTLGQTPHSLAARMEHHELADVLDPSYKLAYKHDQDNSIKHPDAAKQFHIHSAANVAVDDMMDMKLSSYTKHMSPGRDSASSSNSSRSGADGSHGRPLVTVVVDTRDNSPLCLSTAATSKDTSMGTHGNNADYGGHQHSMGFPTRKGFPASTQSDSGTSTSPVAAYVCDKDVIAALPGGMMHGGAGDSAQYPNASLADLYAMPEPSNAESLYAPTQAAASAVPLQGDMFIGHRIFTGELHGSAFTGDIQISNLKLSESPTVQTTCSCLTAGQEGHCTTDLARSVRTQALHPSHSCLHLHAPSHLHPQPCAEFIMGRHPYDGHVRSSYELEQSTLLSPRLQHDTTSLYILSGGAVASAADLFVLGQQNSNIDCTYAAAVSSLLHVQLQPVEHPEQRIPYHGQPPHMNTASRNISAVQGQFARAASASYHGAVGLYRACSMPGSLIADSVRPAFPAPRVDVQDTGGSGNVPNANIQTDVSRSITASSTTVYLGSIGGIKMYRTKRSESCH